MKCYSAPNEEEKQKRRKKERKNSCDIQIGANKLREIKNDPLCFMEYTIIKSTNDENQRYIERSPS